MDINLSFVFADSEELLKGTSLLSCYEQGDKGQRSPLFQPLPARRWELLVDLLGLVLAINKKSEGGLMPPKTSKRGKK